VRFLVDECLSSRMAEILTAAGHDAVHAIERNLAGQPDEAVLAVAVAESRVLVSADTDFGEILARSQGTTPSVILFRRADRRAESLTAVLLANLELVAAELDKGAFVVITQDRLRIRDLPLG
jgi:predicted nuclease of predicted toxin-antitoxin system